MLSNKEQLPIKIKKQSQRLFRDQNMTSRNLIFTVTVLNALHFVADCRKIQVQKRDLASIITVSQISGHNYLAELQTKTSGCYLMSR